MLKQITYLAALCLLLATSCKLPYQTGTFKPDEPFVKLKSGQTFEGESVRTKQRVFASQKIEIDGKSYKSKDVALYSDGRNTFANVGRNTYGEKVFGNDINIFRNISIETSVNSNGSSSSHTRVRDYIQYQNGNKYTYKLMTYGRLKSLIPPDGAAADQLKKAGTNRMIAKICGWGGLAMLFTGSVMAVGAAANDGSPGVGAAVAGIGLGGVIASVPLSLSSRRHQYDAVETHNRSKAKK